MTTALRFLASLAAGTVFCQASTPLEALLEKAGQRASEFAEEFPATACNEKVTQVKFAPGPKVLLRRESLFDYLILLNTEGGDFTVEESRLEKGKQQKDPPEALLATTGFAVMLLVFHPHFQASYRFEGLGPESRDGNVWEKVRFEHESGHASPTVLEVRNRQYPIAWRGVAWIQPETGKVKRIETELREPLEDIGLQTLRSEVEYSSAGGKVWLPRMAVVEAHTKHQHWRNTHEFSSYRRFDVSAETKIQEVKNQ